MSKTWKGLSFFPSGSLIRNAGWMFLGRGLSIVCQGVYFILLAKLLGATEYGIYVGAVAMVSILSQYTGIGSPSVLLRYVSQNTENFTLYWGNVLVTGFGLGAVFVVVLAWAVPHIAHSYAWTMVLCVALGECLCTQLTMAAGNVFQAFEDMRTTALLNLLVNALRAVLAGLMLWRLRHATAGEWAVAALVVSLLAVSVSLVFVTRRYGKPAFSPKLLRERLGEGFVFALSNSTGGIYNDIDKAMLGHYGMNAANGIYTMAYRVIDVANTPIVSIHAAAFPRFFRKGSTGVQSTAAYARKILKRTAPIGLVLAVVLFLGAPIIPHLVNKNFAESVVALRWLCLLPLFRSFQLSGGDALTGAGYQHLRFCAQAAGAIFNFGTNLYLIPHYGWHGAAWSSLATDGLLGIINWMIVGVMYKKVPASVLVSQP